MYDMLPLQAKSLMEDCPYPIANLSNLSALIYQSMDRLNWAGFYIMKDGRLTLGPFQGKVACTEITLNRGVCGAAARENRVQLVYDVHQFPGHIACDCASNSEIVIPIHKGGVIWGVLDIDSPDIGRFTETERDVLQQVVDLMEQMADKVLI